MDICSEAGQSQMIPDGHTIKSDRGARDVQGPFYFTRSSGPLQMSTQARPRAIDALASIAENALDPVHHPRAPPYLHTAIPTRAGDDSSDDEEQGYGSEDRRHRRRRGRSWVRIVTRYGPILGVTALLVWSWPVYVISYCALWLYKHQHQPLWAGGLGLTYSLILFMAIWSYLETSLRDPGRVRADMELGIPSITNVRRNIHDHTRDSTFVVGEGAEDAENDIDNEHSRLLRHTPGIQAAPVRREPDSNLMRKGNGKRRYCRKCKLPKPGQSCSMMTFSTRRLILMIYNYIRQSTSRLRIGNLYPQNGSFRLSMLHEYSRAS